MTTVRLTARSYTMQAKAATLDEALEKAYAAVKKISFEGAHYRTDIGRTK